MRDFISFFVNGENQTVRGGDAFLTLSDYLRLRLGLCGTKIVCSEGDCGSCTVLCGLPDPGNRPFMSPNTGELVLSSESYWYVPIDSCIRFVFQLDGLHIVTIEGLACEGKLNGAQQAMIDCHGSQCGFCTTGFGMAITAMVQNRTKKLNVKDVRHGLTGNLCRCTGYSPIIDAALSIDEYENEDLNQRYPFKPMMDEYAPHIDVPIEIEAPADELHAPRKVYCPLSVVEALKIRERDPKARIVAGATDLGVQFNKGLLAATGYLDLNRINELKTLSTTGNVIHAGACVSWTQLELLFDKKVPQFKEIISVFGSPQIRHVGTIGGNLINASPIADSIPFLFVCDAQLILAAHPRDRTVNIEDFYLDYKKFDLGPQEILRKVVITIPDNIDQLRLYKISRRRDLDISTFTAAILLDVEGDQIRRAKIAYGAVGPTVIRMKKTEEFLVGTEFTEETMQLAGDVAIDEITPLTDVRGSSDYRYDLARNVLLKYFHERKTYEFESTAKG